MNRFRFHAWARACLFGVLFALAGCEAENPPVVPPDSDVPTVEIGSSVIEPVAEPAATSPASYVTSAACRGCHPTEVLAWTGSQHDRAMEIATDETVLGDFEDASFEEFGQSWRFFRRDGAFLVNTVGPNGSRADFEILYTFGVDPLQQYLVALPGGRLQALSVAWDSRRPAAGGQRWFSLFPDEKIEPGDVLHWTGIANRWNTMCAHCHSTNVRKNFDFSEASYDTSWSEIDVACEACHGPGSLHLEWVESGADPSRDHGFGRELGAKVDVRWTMNPTTGIAFRVPPQGDDSEIEICSGCHSRRALISEESKDTRFLDRHMPALLDEGLYFPDGQIQDEVYVYGSFMQSRMARAGVRCGDCHDPHSLELRESGDALCAQCHAPSVFAVSSHHQHPEASPGARCVECHMPSRTYMVVDDRRDHSFRIPRPDLTTELGVPNACNGCHADRDALWAAREIAGWPGRRGAPPERDSPRPSPHPSSRPPSHLPSHLPSHPPSHYGQALAAGRIGAVDGPVKLLALATDPGSPAIARASAVSLLSRYPGVVLVEAIREATADAAPLVRLAAVRAADSLPVDARIGLIGRLLRDPLRAVRIEAARALAGADPERLGGHLARARGPALAEYRHAQQLDADRPTSHVNLALLALSMGQLAEAETHYRRALEIGPYFLPAYVNYSDLLRHLNREKEGEELLRRGLANDPNSAELNHAMGLLLVRLGRTEDALRPLGRANDLAPGVARYAYVFGVALYSGGEIEQALETLRAAHARHPADSGILEGLASICREAGLVAESAGYAKKLQALNQPALSEGVPQNRAASDSG